MRWLTLGCLVVLGACCKSQPRADAGTGPAAGPDEAWLAGTLPADAATPHRGGTVTVRLALEPVGLTRLHDRMAEGTMTRITVGPLYETFRQVAEKVDEPSDRLSVTVTVRAGRTFHDGSPITAADLKAVLDVILDAQKPTSTLRGSLDTIDTVTVVDPRTLKVTFKRPYFLAMHTLLDGVPVMPAAALAGPDFDTLPIHRAPIGSGPFKFEKWEAGVSLSYVRADDRALVDRVVFRFIKDDLAAMTAFEKGELDVMTRVTPATWRALEQQPWAWRDARRVLSRENAYSWLGFNQRQPRFDRAVRRALAMLFPADLIEKNVDLGLEPRTTCPWFDGSKGCDPTVTPIAFDVAGAKRLLAEDGWKDGDGDGVLEREGQTLSFAFLIPAQSTKLNKLVPLYVDSLKQAGIAARIETVDVSAYMSRVRAHDFDAIGLSWLSADDAQDNFQNFHSSQIETGNNFVGYANPEVDQVLTDIRAERDESRRHELERRAHRILYDDQVYLFLGRRPGLDLLRRRVHARPPVFGAWDLATLWVDP